MRCSSEIYAESLLRQIQFIDQKDQSSTYTDMHEIHVERV